jgi:multisubunit Na+/H+ antiporter MnhF subunit
MQKQRFFHQSDLFILPLLLMYSFVLCIRSGVRGFFALDQSIVFDGSYRLLAGQIPFKDFVCAFGPVVFWLQALLFKLLGVNYGTYVFTAALLNVLATITSIYILRLLFPHSTIYSYAAGLLTGSWFYPPFGTPYPEQTAFFFGLITLALVLHIIVSPERRTLVHGLLLFMAGIIAALAILTKQNVGGLLFPLYLLMILLMALPNVRQALMQLITFIAGSMAALLLFLIWLAVKSDIEKFWLFFFQLPSRVGTARLAESLTDFLYYLAGSRVFIGMLPLIVISLLVSWTALWRFIQCRTVRTDRSIKMRALGGLMAAYLIFCSLILSKTVSNDIANVWGLIGIIGGIGIALLLEPGKTPGQLKGRCFSCAGEKRSIITYLLLIYVITTAAGGVYVSLERRTQLYDRAAASFIPLGYKTLSCLAWAEPTTIGNARVSRDDILTLIKRLKSRGDNFFIFPDFTILYGALGVPSPQPVLWFHKGLTYPADRTQALSEWIVRDLRKHHVQTVILERESFIPGRLDDFPYLKSFIFDNFKKAASIGIFDIYEK